MSLQELHIRALEDQVMNLTRDCYYLMSLLNTEDNIDWDSWDQGRKIKEDLERSKDFFETIEQRKINRQQSDKLYSKKHFVPPTMEERRAAAKRAAEQIKQREAAKKLEEETCRLEEENQRFQAEVDARAKWARENYKPEYEPRNPRDSRQWYELERDRINHYSIDQALSDIFRAFDTFKL